MRIALLLIATALMACGDKEPEPVAPATPAPESAVSAAYIEDVRRICNAEELSGANQAEPGQGPMIVAQWLGKNIATQEGRDLLARQGGLPANKRYDFFVTAAKSVGLDSCQTAEAWKNR